MEGKELCIMELFNQNLAKLLKIIQICEEWWTIFSV